MMIRENMVEPRAGGDQPGAIPAATGERLKSSALGQRMAGWLEQRATRKLSPHTIARYANDHEQILDLVASITGWSRDTVDAGDLTPAVVGQAFTRYATTGGASPHSPGRAHSTVAGTITTWNLFMDHLVSTKVITENPMLGIERPKLTKGTPKALRSPTESLTALFVATAQGARPAGRWGSWPARDVAVLVLIATTAIRRGEAISAHIEDLEASASGWQLHVFGKGRKERWVPVDDFAVELILTYLSERVRRFPGDIGKNGRLPDKAPLLVNDRGTGLTPSQAWTIVEGCFRAAGIRSKVPAGALIHALRHTKATLMAGDGASATDIQELLGHESLATSQLYVKASAARVRKAALSSPDIGVLRAALGGEPA